MGLDMYLEGEEFILTDWEKPENHPKVDGFKLKCRVLEIGYWRKHPDLHGFIVKTFADGKDDCENIPLDQNALLKILEATKENKLPHTDGFFFGESNDAKNKETIRIILDALKWLNDEKKEVSKSISYRASW